MNKFPIRHKFKLIFILLCLIKLVKAQNGKPFISNFPPLSYSSNNYPSSPQNWGIIQDVNGRVIVANTSGLLIYDGVDWGIISGTEGKSFFKLAKDGKGQIWTGGINDLGKIVANELGQLSFQSVKDQLPEDCQELGRITNVVSYEGSVFFRSNKHLIKISGDSLQTWKPQNEFIKLVSSSSGVFISEKSEWFKLEKDSLISIARSEERPLPNWRAVFASDQNSHLIVTRRSGLFFLKGDKLLAVDFPLNNFTSNNSCELDMGRIAIATEEHGILIVNSTGELLEIIDEQRGLNTNAALYPYYYNGNIWVALHSGISQISYPTNVSFLGKASGLRGLPLSVSKLNERIFLGTYERGYWVHKDQILGQGTLNEAETPINQIFSQVEKQNRIYIGHANGITSISSSGTERNYEIEGGSSVLFSKHIKDQWLFSGSSNSISIWKINEDGTLSFSDRKTVPHLNYSMAIDAKGSLWTAYDGLSIIEVNNRGKFGKVSTLAEENGFTSELGIIEVSSVSGQILIGTEKGVYSYDSQSNQLKPDSIFGGRFCNGTTATYNITEMNNGDVWVTTNTRTGLLRKQADDSYLFDSLPIVRSSVSDVWKIYEDQDGIVWICATEGLIKYEPDKYVDYDMPFNSFIRKAVVNDTQSLFLGIHADTTGNILREQPNDQIPSLTFSQNNITFSYSSSFYSTDKELEYSSMLVGKDLKWSSWRKGKEINFTNLSEGDYNFQIKARNIYGKQSELASFRFIIAPPWYRTDWAFLFFSLLGISFVIGIVRLNTYRLRRVKTKLEGIVQERTTEIRVQKEIVEQEKKKSDELLLNILPAEVAEELKIKGTSDARQFDHVTVLFTDFVNFTGISSTMSPKDLVEEIHKSFSVFDEIITKHNIEKIKTIGDAYMAVGGLPHPDINHAKRVIAAALDMKEYVEKGPSKFNIRIGINSGPVVAGIVGIKKYAFDIWGDTVNLASRMESNAKEGTVNISKATYELVKNEFEFLSRGKIEIKGKEAQEMFTVIGEKKS